MDDNQTNIEEFQSIQPVQSTQPAETNTSILKYLDDPGSIVAVTILSVILTSSTLLQLMTDPLPNIFKGVVLGAFSGCIIKSVYPKRFRPIISIMILTGTFANVLGRSLGFIQSPANTMKSIDVGFCTSKWSFQF